jgi:mannopine transport system permease protein
MRAPIQIADTSVGLRFSRSEASALMLPLALLGGLFFLGPIVALFLEVSRTGLAGAIDIFREVAGSDLFTTVLIRTYRISLIVTFASVVIGTAIAYFLWRGSPMRQKIGLALVVFPLFTSIVVRTYSWTAVFSRNGMLNTLLVDTGLVERPLRMLGSEAVVLIGMVQIMLPFAILPIFTMLRRIEPDLTRAAHILGAREGRLFFDVVLPLTAPGIAVGGIMVFVISLGFFITPAILGGPGTYMISNLINTEIMTYLNPRQAAVMSLMLLASTLLLLAIASRFGSIVSNLKTRL